MFTMSRATFVLLSLVLSTHAYAGATSRSVQDLYVQSGMEKQAQQLAPTINAGIQQGLERRPDSGGKTAKLAKRLQAAVTHVYGANAVKREMVAHLEKHLEKATTNAALHWLRSDPGRKITRMEIAATTLEGQQQAMAYFQSFEKSPPTDTRVELVSDLALATDAVEMGIETAINVQAAILAALSSQSAKGQGSSISNVKKQLDQQRDAIRETIAQQTIMSFLYTYRDLSDEELGAYIKFANSKSGRAYHDTLSAGFNAALVQAGKGLSKELSKERI